VSCPPGLAYRFLAMSRSILARVERNDTSGVYFVERCEPNKRRAFFGRSCRPPRRACDVVIARYPGGQSHGSSPSVSRALQRR
jgi:hypothetical protein